MRGSQFSLIALALALSACGGHGGNSATIPVNFQAPNTTVTYPASSASVTASAGVGVTASRIDPSGAGSTVTITTNASGALQSITLSVLTPSGTFNQTYTSQNVQPLTGLTLGQLANALEKINNTVLANGFIGDQQAQGQTLSASGYGIWASNDSGGNGRVGVLAIGNLTSITAGPPIGMPTTGQATYNGTTIGAESVGSTQALALIGQAQIIANFVTGAVTTNFTNINTQNIATGATGNMPNLTGVSTITGNAYTGPLAGGGLSGTVDGNFYGAGAAETAGVWQVTGGNITAIGSFGAK